MRRSAWWVAGALVLSAGLEVGCGQSGGAGHRLAPPARGATAAPAPPKREGADAVTLPETTVPDLTRPLDLMEWSRGNRNKEPLSVAQHLARSAGGRWIAFAPLPLDEIKWEPNGMPSSSLTVADTLTGLKNSGTPLAWTQQKEVLLLYFGPQKELDRLQSQPPLEVVGLYVSAETGEAMLKTVGDLWHIHIQADPELLKLRGTLLSARKQRRDEPEARGVLATLYNTNPYYGGEANGEPAPYAGSLEFKVVDRLRFPELMARLADYFGGACRETGKGTWEFTRLTDSRQIAAKIAKLKAAIEEDAAGKATGFSSYASRHGMGGAEPEEPVVIAPIGEETQDAFDSLGMLGQPAVPTLAGFLDAEKAAAAMAAMRVLGEMHLPESDAALVAFAQKLQSPTGKEQALVPLLQRELMRVLGCAPTAADRKALETCVRDDKTPPEVRTAARRALIASGDLTPFQSPAQTAALPDEERTFTLSYRPGERLAASSNAKPAPDSITPLAATTLPNGETWAVFLSGRYGNAQDLWLARGRNFRWIEFLFTGQIFTRAREYGGIERPQPGCCVLKMQGDRVVIAPPHADLAAEEQRLQKAMQNPNLPMPQRQKMAQRYSQIEESTATALAQPLTLSLAALRRDSDQDGLPDVVEKRLGLDPKKADTNGDGVPDGKDQNPLAALPPVDTDRAQLLQAVFTALYGGDPAPDPIVVVLDRADWQAFQGARGRVLCITKDDYARRAQTLSALRCLQFGGPSDAEATILEKDGPCLFNESHTRAEVHFWQWSRPAESSNESPYAMMMRGMGGNLPVDYLARFERKDDKGAWKLIAIKPWKFDTADQAAAEAMRRAQMGGRGFIE